MTWHDIVAAAKARFAARVHRFDEAVQRWSTGGKAAEELARATEAGEPVDFQAGRTRITAADDAARGAVYAIWSVRGRLLREQAIIYEVMSILLGVIGGLLRHFGTHAWVEIGVFAVAILLFETVNTAGELEMKRIQMEWFGRIKFHLPIGNVLRLFTVPVLATCTFAGGMWLYFMIFLPGGY